MTRFPYTIEVCVLFSIRMLFIFELKHKIKQNSSHAKRSWVSFFAAKLYVSQIIVDKLNNTFAVFQRVFQIQKMLYNF